MTPKSIHLHGALTQFSDQPVKLVANDLRDVISGLKSRFPTFKRYMHEYPEMAFVLANEGNKNPRPVYPEFLHTAFDCVDEVHVFPVVEGAGIESTIAAYLVMYGEVSYGTAAFIAAVVVNVAVSFALSAVVNMLSPQTQTGSSNAPSQQPSFLYNGPENVVEQGFQVPIVYGTAMTGSVVVSAGITVEQLPIASGQAAPPANGGGTTQPTSPDPVPWQWNGESSGP